MLHRAKLGWQVVLVLVAVAIASPRASAQDGLRVLVLTIDNQIIHRVTESYITRGLRQAAERNYQCVILQLDTPGGRLDSTREIVKEILNSDVPVIVYIAPKGARAGTTGVFITLAAHVSAMAPDAQLGPPDPLNWARELAEQGGRKIDWAAHSLRADLVIPAKAALDMHFVDLLAADLPELLTALDGRRINLPSKTIVLNTKAAVLERMELSWPERLLCMLARPTLAYLLLLLGFAGVVFEIFHPGLWAPGILGAICLTFAVLAMLLLPINFAGLALIVLGLGFVVMEVKFPAYGVLTVVGILTLVLGSALLIEPSGGIDRVSWLAVAPVSITIPVIMLLLVSNVVRAHRGKVQTGMDTLIGASALVKGDMDGVGYVYVSGELWRAHCEQPLADGETVRIQSYDGLTLFVKPLL